MICGLSLLLLLVGSCKKDKTEPIKEELKVTDYFPNSGNEGTLVTIQGTGFGSNINEVSASFGGAAADVVSATPTAVVIRAPKNGKSGDIVLNINNSNITIGKYTYQDLSVQQIDPANGSAGAHIRIMGAGFGSLKGPAEVFINGKAALVVSASDNLLVAEVPEKAGTGAVTVKVNGKEASGQTFKFQAITAIKPMSGGKGTHVKISGEGFDKVTTGNYVDFNGKQALVTEVTENYLMVIAPDQVATGPLSVTINNQKTAGPVFTVVPLPKIATVSPLSGPAGSEMTIVGSTFSTIKDENKVIINGKELPITSVTDNKIVLTIPGGTGNGKVVLSVNDQVVEGPEFKDQSLGINKMSPDNGLAGTQVTISGSGFNTVASSNIVTFNGVGARVVSATESSLVVIAPNGLSTGAVKVVNNGETAISPTSFNRAGVLTFAGGPSNTDLSISRFGAGIAVDRQGNVFVLEQDFHRIKKITPQGTISLFAGSATGQSGNQNGSGTDASFSFGPYSGIAIDDNDNLFISDYANQCVRKVTPQGVVSNFAVNLGTMLTKIAIDEQGTLFVQRGYQGMWKIDKTGAKVALPGLSNRDEASPVAVGSVVYFTDYEGYKLTRFDYSTSQNTYGWVGYDWGFADGVGRVAMFSSIKSLIYDKQGSFYVNDGGNMALRKVDIARKELTTLATFGRGYQDGGLKEAKFSTMSDMTMDKDGNIYMIDIQNNAIRKIFLK